MLFGQISRIRDFRDPRPGRLSGSGSSFSFYPCCLFENSSSIRSVSMIPTMIWRMGSGAVWMGTVGEQGQVEHPRVKLFSNNSKSAKFLTRSYSRLSVSSQRGETAATFSSKEAHDAYPPFSCQITANATVSISIFVANLPSSSADSFTVSITRVPNISKYLSATT